jgi:curved DNA-binding protein CbpA
MKTLYDLLGALPQDDAQDLRTAFRRAVKGAHPDIRPGDPDAALKFRQIVNANEILGDAEQRAAYDHLLELARLEQQSASARATAVRIHKLASGTIALAGASVVTVGGYLLFMHMSVASIAPANQLDVTMRAPAEIAAASPAGPSDTTDNRASLAKTDKSASLAKRESASVPGAAIVPSAAMLQPKAENVQAAAENVPAAHVGPPLDLAASNARALRARGVSAYRNGDLNGAIADLDQAIQLDPKFLAAYIDRGIIFYRLRKIGRAFADIAQAKRIEKRVEKPSRSISAPATAGKQRVDQARIAPSVQPVSQQQTAAQDPSREEWVATLRLR